MEAVIASIFRSWFDKLTTNGRYIEAFIFAVRLEGMQGLRVQEALLLTADVEETVTTTDDSVRILPLWKWLVGSEL